MRTRTVICIFTAIVIIFFPAGWVRTHFFVKRYKMKAEFIIAVTQLAAERNLPKEVVLKAIEQALLLAFKKNSNQDISVRISPQTGEVKVLVPKVVVKRVADAEQEISLSQAKKLKPEVGVGETIEVESTPEDAGRIAAQTVKQIMSQRLREAERDIIFGEYADKEGDIVSGVIRYIEPRQIVVNVGGREAILPFEEQIHEHYRMGQRLKFYLLKVSRDNKATQLILSRSHPNLVSRLLELEVPEIRNGAIELKAVAREPGSRSKIALAACQEGIDPIGCSVGPRSLRIQNVTKELNGERLDLIQWDADPAIFITNALSPASVLKMTVNEAERFADVIVADDQLSPAIGKGGQNARLAARLTGWRINIKTQSMVVAEAAKEEITTTPEPAEASPPATEAAEPPAKDYSMEEVLSELERATKVLQEIHFTKELGERTPIIKPTKKAKIKKVTYETDERSDGE
jgi:N utilization substance protein A